MCLQAAFKVTAVDILTVWLLIQFGVTSNVQHENSTMQCCLLTKFFDYLLVYYY